MKKKLFVLNCFFFWTMILVCLFFTAFYDLFITISKLVSLHLKRLEQFSLVKFMGYLEFINTGGNSQFKIKFKSNVSAPDQQNKISVLFVYMVTILWYLKRRQKFSTIPRIKIDNGTIISEDKNDTQTHIIYEFISDLIIYLFISSILSWKF